MMAMIAFGASVLGSSLQNIYYVYIYIHSVATTNILCEWSTRESGIHLLLTQFTKADAVDTNCSECVQCTLYNLYCTMFIAHLSQTFTDLIKRLTDELKNNLSENSTNNFKNSTMENFF